MGETSKAITGWFLFFLWAPGSTGSSHPTASTICWACGSAWLRPCPTLKPPSLTCSKRIRQKSQKRTSRPGWSLCTSYWGRESRETAALRCQRQSLTWRAPMWIRTLLQCLNLCGMNSTSCVFVFDENNWSRKKKMCFLRKTDQLIPFLGVLHRKGGTAGLASSGVLRLSVEVSVFRRKGK